MPQAPMELRGAEAGGTPVQWRRIGGRPAANGRARGGRRGYMLRCRQRGSAASGARAGRRQRRLRPRGSAPGGTGRRPPSPSRAARSESTERRFPRRGRGLDPRGGGCRCRSAPRGRRPGRCCGRWSGAERSRRLLLLLPPRTIPGAGYKMALPSRAALLLLLLALLGSAAGGCPAGCACTGDTLSCAGSALPRDLPRWPRHL